MFVYVHVINSSLSNCKIRSIDTPLLSVITPSTLTYMLQSKKTHHQTPVFHCTWSRSDHPLLINNKKLSNVQQFLPVRVFVFIHCGVASNIFNKHTHIPEFTMKCFNSSTCLMIAVCYFYGLFCNNLFVQGQTQWGKVRASFFFCLSEK